MRIARRYGVPGLSLIAPVLIGVSLAAVIMLVLKCPKLPTAIWLTVSVALWSILVGILSFQGLTLFGWF